MSWLCGYVLVISGYLSGSTISKSGIAHNLEQYILSHCFSQCKKMFINRREIVLKWVD